MSKPIILSFYLPQFHPTAENNEWWSEGFTEWTNVGKAKKYYPSHYQPKVPADLGYYDLRLPEVREKQAILAKEAGIDGFCYWHYWYNGKRLLDLPIREVLESKKPDFPFCFCWANHSWYAKRWDNRQKDRLLIEQTYPGVEDYVNHFNEILPAFKDERYIKVANKPIFGIYSPKSVPEVEEFIKLWNKLAKENGFDGIHFVCISFSYDDAKMWLKKGFDAVIFDPMFFKTKSRYFFELLHLLFRVPTLFNYNDYTRVIIDKIPIDDRIYPCVIPNFDHTPRSGEHGNLFYNSSPRKWEYLLKALFEKIKIKKKENNIVFVKSWNEWGEGNYLEPDLKYGRSYLDATRAAKDSIE